MFEDEEDSKPPTKPDTEVSYPNIFPNVHNVHDVHELSKPRFLCFSFNSKIFLKNRE